MGALNPLQPRMFSERSPSLSLCTLYSKDIAVACNRDLRLVDARGADEILRIKVISKGEVIYGAVKDARNVFEICALADNGHDLVRIRQGLSSGD